MPLLLEAFDILRHCRGLSKPRSDSRSDALLGPWAPLCSSVKTRPERVTWAPGCQGSPMAGMVDIESQNFPSSACCEEVNSHRSSKSSYEISRTLGKGVPKGGTKEPLSCVPLSSHKLVSCLC